MPVRSCLALILAWCLAAGAAEAEAEYLGAYHWTHDGRAFRGFSALEITADGSEVLAISDIGVSIAARLEREGGVIVGIESKWLGALFAPDGTLKRQIRNDAEGLAGDPAGPFYLSMERNHRVVRHAHRAAPEEPLPALPKELRARKQNEGLEALAMDAGGRLYTFPQTSGGTPPVFPVYRLEGEAWAQPFSLPALGRYDAVGADFGPDGQLYVLERWFRGPLGFRTRVRRFTLSGDGTAVASEETLLTATSLTWNFEGLAIWRDEAGNIRLTMITDNNSKRWLGTWLAEFRLNE